MKWVFLAVTASIPLLAMSKQGDAEAREKAIQEKEKTPQPPPFDADLFRKDEQICSAHAEFLYWTVAEGCLDYAQKMEHAAWGPTPSFAQGRYENATYNIDPGFRIGFLYFRAPHYWEVKWQYTRMTNRGYSKTSKPSADAKFLTGTWPQITSAPLATASTSIHLNYNVFDYLVTRVFVPNPHLRLRLIGGATGAWMDQDWNIHYSDSSSQVTAINNRWDFIGGGLKMGTMVDWYWTHDIYVTALGSFGALMGDYSNHSKQTTSVQSTPLDNTAVPIRDTSYHDTRPAFTTQMLLGPSWQKNYPKNRIEVFAGFEMNFWFNLNEVYRSTANTPSFDKQTWIASSILSLYGLTTRLTVDF